MVKVSVDGPDYVGGQMPEVSWLRVGSWSREVTAGVVYDGVALWEGYVGVEEFVWPG